MDPNTTVETVLNTVISILTTQSSRFSPNERSHATDSGQGSLQSPSILPQHIPSLPLSATTLPQEASDNALAHISELLATHVLPHLSLSSLSPRYYGFVTGGATPAALVADILASIYDQNAAVHLPKESIATTIEAAALNLLVDLFHLPKNHWGIGRAGNGGGVITTGATASNVLGLALGREHVLNEAISRKQSLTQSSESKSASQPKTTLMSVGQHGLLKVSRAAEIDEIVVISTLPHSSMVKAAGILGIGRDNFFSIAKEDQSNPELLRFDFEVLEQKLKTAQQDRTAYIVSVSAGEVNTARYATHGLQEMQRIRQLCDEHGAWLHVDGAFGLFGRALMTNSSNTDHDKTQQQSLSSDTIESEYHEIIQGVQGLELADSITGDGHKLLNVPYDCGLFFTRHKTLSEAVLSNGNAAYLTASLSSSSAAKTKTKIKEDEDEDDDDDDDRIQSPLNIGIENSRRFRALPVYATLLAYGRDGYTDMLRRQITLARRIVAWMYDYNTTNINNKTQNPSNLSWEILPQSSSKEEAISKTFIGVLFRVNTNSNNDSSFSKNKDFNDILVQKINETGRIYVTGTQWAGNPAARIAVSNWRVDVERDLEVVVQVLRGVLEGFQE